MDELFETLQFPGIALRGNAEAWLDEARGAPGPGGPGTVARTSGPSKCRATPARPSRTPLPNDPARVALLSDVAVAAQAAARNAGLPPPASHLPYDYVGMLDEMPAVLDRNGAPYCGLYLIIFPPGVPREKPRAMAYSGQSGDLRSRLMQHRLCAKVFNLPTRTYPVYIWHLPNATAGQRRALELAFHWAIGIGPQSLLANLIHELPPFMPEWESERFVW